MLGDDFNTMDSPHYRFARQHSGTLERSGNRWPWLKIILVSATLLATLALTVVLKVA